MSNILKMVFSLTIPKVPFFPGSNFSSVTVMNTPVGTAEVKNVKTTNLNLETRGFVMLPLAYALLI